jgi:hypothetical protein
MSRQRISFDDYRELSGEAREIIRLQAALD